MPELRKDPIVHRWVIIATERARRPGNFVDTLQGHFKEAEECLYCGPQPKTLHLAKTGNLEANPQDWDVCVVPFNYQEETPVSFLKKQHGLYETIDGFGERELIIETSQHSANLADFKIEHIKLILKTYAERMKRLEGNPQYKHVLTYKNYGAIAGSDRVAHARSYVVANPVNPLRVEEKLLGAKTYFKNQHACIFCHLLGQELDAQDRIVLETKHFAALIPFAARFLFEIWILPKKHESRFVNSLEGDASIEGDLALMLKTILKKIQKGLGDPAYNYVIQTAPLYKEERVDDFFHWHIEIMPRLTRIAGFEKGTGFYICAVPPEDMASYLRGIK